MNVYYIPVQAATDSLVVVQPDTLWVGNWPAGLIDTGPSFWFTTVIPVFISAALSLWAASWMYSRQRRDTERANLGVAFNLFYSICDEMYRAKERVWNMIEFAQNRRFLRGPFVLNAKESLLSRLTEVMPHDWSPRAVYRFYEQLTLVAYHHNRGTSIPDTDIVDVMRMSRGARSGRQPMDPNIHSEMRSGQDARQYALSFALRYYDANDRDSLSSLFEEAISQLKALAQKVGADKELDLEVPSGEERQRRLNIVTSMMSQSTEGKNFYDGLVDD